jgi:Rps23 Pro-64 3,4-dihydroxylase Tpa1-like proline 4-hydroxylase
MTHLKNVFVKRDFLTKPELHSLTKYVLDHEPEFSPSTVIPHEGPESSMDVTYRRSLVLYNLGEYTSMIKDRLLTLLPDVLTAFKHETFPVAHVDIQLTASNDGDFFRMHQDNSSAEINTREISFVYYFHSEPKAFTGGQLKLYNSRNGEVEHSDEVTAQTITPRQNTVVLFQSSYDHEVLPVRCPSRKFVNSRFTVNGWIMRPEKVVPAKKAKQTPRPQPEDMSWLVEAANALSDAYPGPWPKLYLTLAEASEFSGLSREYLQKLIQQKKLTAIDDGGVKVRRLDLERL